MAEKPYRTPECVSPLLLTDIEALVFDLDGTLAHSNPDFPAIRHALGIAPGTDILMHVQGLAPQEQAKAMALVHEYEMAAAARAHWVDGARELMLHLARLQRPTAILTRNTRPAAELTLSRLGLSVDILLTREDAPPKPDPTGLISIVSTLGLIPSQVLYLGDYLFDLQTATRAGCAAGLYCPDAVPGYASMANVLVPCYWGLADALNAAWSEPASV